MKLFSLYAVALAGASVSNALAVPEITDLSIREAIPDFLDISAPIDAVNDLFKRKGGGGRGGGGGGSTSSGGGSSTSGGGRPSTGGSGGGSTSSGSRGTGVAPTYNGGRYYGGGASTPYTAGSPSSGARIPSWPIAAPFLIFPGLWIAGAYAYNYNHPYHFYNRTATNSSNPDGTNQTKPVTCLCAKYNPCGCDDNGDSAFLDGLVGNGSYAALNKTLVNVADVNGSSTIVINGTLPNGTDAASTATGSGNTGAAALMAVESAGYWVMAASVVFSVWGL